VEHLYLYSYMMCFVLARIFRHFLKISKLFAGNATEAFFDSLMFSALRPMLHCD
jgi:hypothetical protein